MCGNLINSLSVYPRYKLRKNDVIYLMTGTGGGYGSPLKRPAEKVLRDVKNGYISIDEARDIFGVDINRDLSDYKESEGRKGLK